MKKLALILGVIILGIVLLAHHQAANHAAVPAKTKTSQTASTKNSQKTTGSKSSSKSKTGSSSSVKVNDGACMSVLSTATAQKVLGASVTAQRDNGVMSQTVDITTTNCAYTAGADVASAVLHAARTSVGASTNDLTFGSERPHDAVSVKGYGSAAFWQPSTGELNILKDNNWYVIHCVLHSRASVSGAEAIAAAAHLQS